MSSPTSPKQKGRLIWQNSTVENPYHARRRAATKTRLTKEDWEPHKKRILQLYISENKNLNDVRRIMSEEVGFEASASQYKSALGTWEATKYQKLTEVQQLHAIGQRKSREKTAPYGHTYDAADAQVVLDMKIKSEDHDHDFGGMKRKREAEKVDTELRRIDRVPDLSSRIIVFPASSTSSSRSPITKKRYSKSARHSCSKATMDGDIEMSDVSDTIISPAAAEQALESRRKSNTTHNIKRTNSNSLPHSSTALVTFVSNPPDHQRDDRGSPTVVEQIKCNSLVTRKARSKQPPPILSGVERIYYETIRSALAKRFSLGKEPETLHIQNLGPTFEIVKIPRSIQLPPSERLTQTVDLRRKRLRAIEAPSLFSAQKNTEIQPSSVRKAFGGKNIQTITLLCHLEDSIQTDDKGRHSVEVIDVVLPPIVWHRQTRSLY